MTNTHFKGGSKSRKLRRSVKRGGDGAADHAIKVFGAGQQQHANPAFGNLIAVNGGGKRKGKKGGDAITSIAVPAVLIAANQLYKKNKTLKNYMRGGNANAVLDMAAGTLGKLNQKLDGGETQPPLIIQTGAGAPSSASFGVPVSSGGGKKRKGKKVGSGAFAEIAVPIALIAANRFYKKEKRAYGTRKRGGKSTTGFYNGRYI